MASLFRQSNLVGIVMAAMLLLAPTSVLANTWSGAYSGGTLTVWYPDSYASCSPSDTITVSGIQPDHSVTLMFQRWDETTNIIYEVGDPVTLTGDGTVPFPYPAIAGGTLTFVVTLFDDYLMERNTIKGLKWVITCQPSTGGEGCTPGYWRNHLEDWPPTGYDPSDIFDSVFGTSYFGPAYTLNQAIRQGGGGLNRAARHGTAALLSAAHPDVDYPYTVEQVFTFVQTGTIDPLVQANELGCQIR